MEVSETPKQSVLIIDDDAVVGQSFDRVLSEGGFRVRTALDGQAGLDLIEETHFDLVFTDIKMPGLDGLEVAERIKKSHPELPVVIATGFGSEANEAQARQIGVAEFVRKPLSPDLITMITNRALLREAEHADDTTPETAIAVSDPPVNVAKNIALFFASPFIGLAYIVALPFVGAWMLLSALRNPSRGSSEQ